MLEGVAEPFLGMPGIDIWLFVGLSFAAMVTAFIAAVVGTAGGLILIAIMAFVFPPALLIPLHTVIQLGVSASMLMSRWRYMMVETLVPFIIGAVIGAAIGGNIFINLSEAVLLMILGVSMLILTWIPAIARFGPQRGRFVFVGFITTFLGIFISATGTMLAAFTAAAAPERRNHIATLGGLMAVVHIAKLVAFGFLGVEFGSYFPLVAAMIATSFVGIQLGKPVLDRIPEKLFRTVLQIALTLLAFRLIAKALGW